MTGEGQGPGLIAPALARSCPSTDPPPRCPPPIVAPPDRTAEIEASGLFGGVVRRDYRWDEPYDAEGYLRVLSTYSGHIALEPASRGRLFRGLRDLIEEEHGGRIVKGYATTLYVARRK